MPFVLRQSRDESNPQLPDLYGRALTEGRLVYWNYDGTNTYFLILLARGGKYGLDGLDFFRYRGVSIPELQTPGDEQTRNWRFHPGKWTRQVNQGSQGEVGFNDPEQGRPQFFPWLDLTFSGIAYIEGKLPANLSSNEEPNGFQIGLRGRRITDFDGAGNIIGVNFSANNARIYADILLNELKLPISRLDLPSFYAFKQASDVMIWHRAAASGSGVGLQGKYYAFAAGASPRFDDLRHSRLDAQIDFQFGLNQPAPNTPATYYAVRWEGWIKPQFTETYTFSLEHDDGARLWINNQPLIDNSQVATSPPDTATIALQANVPVRIKIEYWNGVHIGTCRLRWSSPSLPLQIVPSARLYPTDSQVRRHEAHIPFVGSTLAWSALEEIMRRAPGWHAQDVNGKIKFLPPNRPVVHRFLYDPDAEDERWNIAAKTFEAKPRSSDERPNWRLHFFRDLYESLYPERWVEGDRPLLREKQGGLPTDTAPARWGVMSRSLTERCAEMEMRLFSDSDREFILRGQTDSYHVSKGDRVELAHIAAGETVETVIECIVTSEGFSAGAADEKSYALLPVTFPLITDEPAQSALPSKNDSIPDEPWAENNRYTKSDIDALLEEKADVDSVFSKEESEARYINVDEFETEEFETEEFETEEFETEEFETEEFETEEFETEEFETEEFEAEELPEHRLLPEPGNNGQILRLVNGQWVASDEQSVNLSGYQQTSQKNQAGGYAGLDANVQIAGNAIPLSPDSGNILEIRNNKLYATAPSGGSGGLSSVSTSNSTSVKFTGNGTAQNQLSATVARSATPGLLIQNNDGLAAPLFVNNTNPTKTVQLSGSGTASNPLVANVNISTDPGNAIENREGRLYVATVSPDGGLTAVTHAPDGDIVFAGSGTPQSPLTATIKDESVSFGKMQRIAGGKLLGASGTGEQQIGEITIGANLTLVNNVLSGQPAEGGGMANVLTDNTPTVRFEGDGTMNAKLKAHARKSATNPGILTEETDGLAARINVSNTNPLRTVQLSGNGTAASPLAADVQISSDVGNALENREGRLYVATVSPDGGLTAVSHTNTNSATMTGNGTANSPLAVVVKRSATPGLLIEQTDGLAAPLIVSNTNPLRTVLLLGNGTASSPLSADVQISTDPGNAIENREGKLYVATVSPDGGLTAVTHASTGDIAFSGAGTPDNPLIANVRSERITFNKMQRIAGGRILGASGTGEQIVSEIQIGGGLTLVNNVLSAAVQEGGLTGVLTDNTPTVRFEGDGTMNAKLKAHARKSATNPGILTEETDGLAARINVSNTNPLRTVTLGGNGTTANPLTAQANISTEANNLLQNLDGALYVPPPTITQIPNLQPALEGKAGKAANGFVVLPNGRHAGVIVSATQPTTVELPQNGDLGVWIQPDTSGNDLPPNIHNVVNYENTIIVF